MYLLFLNILILSQCNSNIIKGICDTQHITIEKLSQVTGIPIKRLEHIQNGSIPTELESNMLKMVSMSFIYEIMCNINNVPI